MEKILLILYIIPLIFIFSYSLVQLGLIINYLGAKNKNKNLQKLPNNFPIISIQLPIYNELYVVERLLDAVANFDYPKDKLEIQVLDDSTDETVQIIAIKVAELQAKGIDIQHIRRDNRVGFKAGALAYGLKKAKGEFIAIFDADFLPPQDFLQKTIAFFQDSEVGLVQTKWQHLNESFSLLTQIQAFGLDAHFTVEQVGRNAQNHFINFNGTAGIWRKITILDAGGWSADTLTEDLDLSYRAQMKGWKFQYLSSVNCPAELPVTMSAIKSQQYRWAKGAAECIKKNVYNLLIINKVKFSTKVFGLFHLMNSAIFVAILFMALLSVPALLFSSTSHIFDVVFRYASFFQVSWLILGMFYWVSFREEKSSVFQFIKLFFLFLIFMMGLALHNAIAVVEGWLGINTPFVRTPKFNIKTQQDSWLKNKYLSPKINPFVWLEIVFFLYVCLGIFLAFRFNNFGMLPFHLMLALGLFGVIFYTFKQAKRL